MEETNEQPRLPSEYDASLTPTYDPYNWLLIYRGNVSREDAEAWLKPCAVGTFFVRDSSKGVNCYVLSIRCVLLSP